MAVTATKRAVERSNGLSNRNHQTTNGNGSIRTTAIFSSTLNKNWEACALQKELQKNEILVLALSAYLRSEGFEPERVPKVKVSY